MTNKTDVRFGHFMSTTGNGSAYGSRTQFDDFTIRATICASTDGICEKTEEVVNCRQVVIVQ